MSDKTSNKFLAYNVIALIIITASSMAYVMFLPSMDDIILKSEVDKNYIDKNLHTTKMKQLQKTMGNKIQTNEKVKVQEKIVEVEKVVEVEKIVEVEKVITKYKDINIDKNKFNRVSCYDMKNGDYTLSKQCIKKVEKFLDNHKDSKLFEVIGVVDKTDFALINQVELKKYKTKTKQLYQLAQFGLSKKRAIEGVWLIKNYLGTNINTQVTNYHAVSKKHSKGFIIKAYEGIK